ncbi:hypothetical protein RHGRI_001883 [Rhododendron griersonianum]|uniref:CCHC-type domain-containing protein n=1 Tax=Rhododendron griersonianum TaxID=479676 RepID=A0AAV6LLR0_9ERIC|nr:hypothetical protein RHGRI_001883 [Rhododendron griersonianum]
MRKFWDSCIRGYRYPMKTIEEKQVPKFTSELSVKEKAVLQANNRALDILFSAVDVKEHRKIANCEIAKEAWDILVTCHEETDVIKQSKLQRLTTEFEIIRMQEDETFNEIFYSKLIAIVNSCETLGEPIPPFRVIKKILRSLPERFKTKVTMLEGKCKLNEKSIEEVVGLLQTCEADMLQPESLKSKIKPSAKSIAFASSQSESRESNCDSEYDLEAMDLFTKNFKQIFKKRITKGDGNMKFENKRESESSSGKETKGIKGPPVGSKCYECQGYGHLAHECINKYIEEKD